jgi:hypothetical protein
LIIYQSNTFLNNKGKPHPDFEPPNSVCLLSSNPKSHQPSIRWRSVLRFLPVIDIGLAGGKLKPEGDSGDGGMGGGLRVAKAGLRVAKAGGSGGNGGISSTGRFMLCTRGRFVFFAAVGKGGKYG